MQNLDNNEEFIHAIFAQLCSSIPIKERLIDNFNLPRMSPYLINFSDKILIEDLKPIIIEEDVTKHSLKKKPKIKKNKSKKQKTNKK